MNSTRAKWSARLPLVLVVVAMLVYLVLIPPFQNPDEVQHFAGIAAELYPISEHARLETAIIHILWETRWFVFVGMAQPDRPPEKLSRIYFLRNVQGSFSFGRGLNLFHQLYARILRPFRKLSLVNLFYLARLLSLLWTLLSLLLAYRFLATRPDTAAGPRIWLFFLVPQFMILGTAVNYDVLAVFFGTLFFVSLFRLTERFSWWQLAGIMIGLFGALFAKKGGWLFFFFLLAGLLLGKGFGRRFRTSFLALAGTVLLFSWVNYLLPGKIFKLYHYLFTGIGRLYECDSATSIAMGFGDFLLVLGKSFFAMIGWMAFDVHWIWYAGFFFIFGVALLAWATKIFKHKERYLPVFAVLVLVIQVAAIWQWYGNRGIAPQGRYIFPLWLPLIMVMIAGLRRLDQRFSPHRGVWTRVYLGGLVLANAMVIFARIIPVFYLAMRSPHGGM